MTWEETVLFARSKKEYHDLMRDAYLEADLVSNNIRFKNSEEYKETRKLIDSYFDKSALILDVGAGNGIASLSFAQDGFKVVALEPDTSDTVGAGAIRYLKEIAQLDNLEIVCSYAEQMPFSDGSFEVIYARQAMHHANNLSQFVSECHRVLKHGGIMLTVRDHVITGYHEKQKFLNSHPLNTFYHGENAYKLRQYTSAFKHAGFEIIKVLGHYQTPINYAPLDTATFSKQLRDRELLLVNSLKRKFGPRCAANGMMLALYSKYVNLVLGNVHDEKKVLGRHCLILARKA